MTESNWQVMEQRIPGCLAGGLPRRVGHSVGRAFCLLRGFHSETTVVEHYFVYTSAEPTFWTYKSHGLFSRSFEERQRYIVICKTCHTQIDS